MYSEEELAELEERYDKIDEKLILIQMLMELTAIREAVTETREDVTAYRCDHCGTEVAAQERIQHATEKHNAPPGADVTHLFTPL